MELLAVVALGNPGLQYAKTRHNAGVWLLEELLAPGLELKRSKNIAVESIKGPDNILYMRATDYMNNSGLGVGACLRYFKIAPTNVLVLHDELDLAPGIARLKFAGGDAGHNGLKSLSAHLSGPGYWRLRIGIGRPPLGHEVSSFVLGQPSQDDLTQIQAAIKLVKANFAYLQRGDSQAFMRKVHN